MFHIILFNPEIPPNTGNIMRLCSNTGSNLHLIKPLGFDLNSKNLKRAALDYSEISNLKVYDSLEDCFSENKFNNVFAITKFGKENLFFLKFEIDDAFLFGNETSTNLIMITKPKIPIKKEIISSILLYFFSF